MKKISLMLWLCMVMLPLSAQDYFTGSGGAGQSLTVLAPQGKNLGQGEAYLLNFVQGVIAADFTKFSKITVLDWQSLEKVLAETEKLVYAGNNDIIAAGNITQTQYILQGELTKTGAGYALQFRITDTKTGSNRASYTGTCTKAQLDNMSGAKTASADLLSQMGVNLTAQGKTALLAVTGNTAEAQTALAKGITAQRSGTVVEALSYYLTSVSYDPSLNEAASRSNVLSQNISSGNIGNDVRNDIQWRKDWIARLTEAEQYFANQTKDPAPYYLTYSMDPKQGNVDYAKETVSISGLTINLFPSNAAWFSVPVQVVNTVRDGFMKTGRASAWDLNWPRYSVSKSSPFQDRYERIVVSVELLNDKGTVIGKQDVYLQGGWGLDTYNGFELSFRSDKSEATFYSVNANLITDKLNIRIASIDGVNTNTAAKNKRISIMTVAEYNKQERARRAALEEQERARLAEEQRIVDERHKQGVYYIGETGPAGGFVFYDKGIISNGWRYLEAAPFDNDDLDSRFRITIGGYKDWRLPTRQELNLMYDNLKKKNIGNFSDTWYRAGGGLFSPFAPTYRNFKDGTFFDAGTISGIHIRPVRQF